MNDATIKDKAKINKRAVFFLSFIVVSFIVHPALALPKDDLAQTKKDMAASNARQAELAEKAKAAEAELSDISRKLVKAAADVQASEAELTKVEETLRVLSEQQQAKQQALNEQKKHLADMTQAALHLSQMPPEAVVMMPGDSLAQMKASRALRMTSDAIKDAMRQIELQMQEIAGLKEKIERNRASIKEKQAGLEKERQRLASLLGERKKLLAKLGSQQQEEAEKLAQLARKAADLQGLIRSLGAREKEPRPAPAEQEMARKGKVRSIAKAKGALRLPVAGAIVRKFGAPENGGTSKGISISTRENASVVAIYDGEVAFTGPFLNYGKLVIIKHSDDFYTLVAGLAEINTKPGEFLLEGEPIGAMGDKAARVYVEMRKGNQPVDPAGWLKE